MHSVTMRRFGRCVLASVLALLVAARIAPAQAGVTVYQAALSGANESPPNASPGSGGVTVTCDDGQHTMRVQATFSDVIATVTVAHIHAPTTVPLAGNAGVATTTPSFPGFPSGVFAGTYDRTFDMTLSGSYNPSYLTANGASTAMAEAALFTAMAAGKAYFNIHTSTFPGGEIRGFLTPVPLAAPDPRHDTSLDELVSLAASPNPVTREARISVVLSRAAPLRTEVLDLGGRCVRRLDRRDATAGPLALQWDGRDTAGHRLTPGLYFVRVTAREQSKTIRVALLD